MIKSKISYEQKFSHKSYRYSIDKPDSYNLHKFNIR